MCDNGCQRLHLFTSVCMVITFASHQTVTKQVNVHLDATSHHSWTQDITEMMMPTWHLTRELP